MIASLVALSCAACVSADRPPDEPVAVRVDGRLYEVSQRDGDTFVKLAPNRLDFSPRKVAGALEAAEIVSGCAASRPERAGRRLRVALNCGERPVITASNYRVFPPAGGGAWWRLNGGIGPIFRPEVVQPVTLLRSQSR